MLWFAIILLFLRGQITLEYQYHLIELQLSNLVLIYTKSIFELVLSATKEDTPLILLCRNFAEEASDRPRCFKISFLLVKGKIVKFKNKEKVFIVLRSGYRHKLRNHYKSRICQSLSLTSIFFVCAHSLLMLELLILWRGSPLYIN